MEDPIDIIQKNITMRELYECLAEEASELAQASLKMIRLESKGNTTNKTFEETYDNLIEEYTDVYNIASALLKIEPDFELSYEKLKRWANRIEEAMSRYKVYRVEDIVGQHGIWRDFDGSFNPVFNKLSHGKCRDMPMEDSNFYREGGKRWFSATDTPEKLKEWFSEQDVREMLELGYHVIEFEVTELRPVNEYEVVFTRESIRGTRLMKPEDIWPELGVTKK